MATSSIFASFDITDAKKANAFVAALEKSAQSHPRRRVAKRTLVTSRKRVKALVKAALGNK